MPSEWSWRDNQYRPRAIEGIPSREFASGITITHRALARIGYLYLREGRWRERQLLPREFVRTATTPTDLPVPFPGYAFYWMSNGRGTFPDLPRDAYWALGLGDSFVAVIPSLELVVVRLGVGARRSHFPGSEQWGGDRVAGFLRVVLAAMEMPLLPLAPPYPPSPAIAAIEWAPAGEIVRRAHGSDNWPLTWGDDDHQYTAYGDGWGFEPRIAEKLSLGFARVEGMPPDFRGVNLRAPTGEAVGDGPAGKKASGILTVDGTLYLWGRNAGNSQLAWSTDRSATWSWADWRWTESFGCPTFLNFGRNYAGARDGYVYVYSPDGESAYRAADRMILARVPKDRIRERAAYEFYAGRAGDGSPRWTDDIARRAAVFTFPGRCYRSGITYNAGLKRYLWCQTLPAADPRFEGGLAIYDAPEPWGPWTTVFFARRWDVGPGESSAFPTRWMSADGRTAYLVFSGDDCFSVRRAVFRRR